MSKSLTKAAKKAESLEAKDQREKAMKKAQKLQLTKFMIGGALGFAEGFAESADIKFVTEGLGPLKFEYVQAGAGLYLAMQKKGDARELGESLATIGLYKIGKGFGSGFSLGGLFGGD